MSAQPSLGAQAERSWLAVNPMAAFALAPLFFGGLWVAVNRSAEPHFVTSFSGYLLVQLLAAVVFTDLKSRRIPNWATYPTFLWAIGINLVAFLAPTSASWLGAVGLQQSLVGGFGMLAIMFVLFSITGGGAGDVKLTACLGALLGWTLALDALLYSFVVAGAGLLIYAIWVNGPFSILAAVFRTVGYKLMPLAIDPPATTQTQLLKKKFPLAPFFAAGTALALFWNLP